MHKHPYTILHTEHGLWDRLGLVLARSRATVIEGFMSVNAGTLHAAFSFYVYIHLTFAMGSGQNVTFNGYLPFLSCLFLSR